MGSWTRRDVLQGGLLLASAALSTRCFRGSVPPPIPADLPDTTPWRRANEILAETTRPTFPAAEFPVGVFGARGDGRTDDTVAFSTAIGACHGAGGGHVTVPAGVFVVGALRLRSRVDLHLEVGATLRFSSDASLYPAVLTRYEGIECLNRSPMIYALGERDVALTGEGTLDASRTAAWNQGGDREGVLEPLVARALPPEERVVVGRLRTSFVQPYGSTNVLIEGVTLVGAQFWQLHPTLCRNVTIEGVTTTVSGANSDGCVAESCDHVVVRRSTLASGDDNIALKSGRDVDGRRVATPCREIVILNCQAEGRFGFLTCGSEQSGGIEGVYAFNNWTYGRGVGSVLWVKSNARRGGFTRDVHIERFRGAGFRSAAIAMTMRYDDQPGDSPPAFSDFFLGGLDVSSAPYAIDLDGLAERPIGRIVVSDSRFVGIDEAARLRRASPIEWRNTTVNGRPMTG